VVELALVLTPLILIIVAIVQFGFWFEARSTLRDGVRAATRQASLCRSISGFDDATAYSAYHAIVDSSVANAVDPTISWGTDPPNQPPICIAGTRVTVTGSYNYPINILGLIRVGGDQLTATAVGVVE
jgi:Flp pilus assembly protein TadG